MNLEQKKILNAINLAFFSNQEAILKLFKSYSAPEDVYKLKKEDLKNLGFKENTIEEFLKRRQEIDIENEWKKLERENIKVITKDEKEYPPLLKEIANPPILLYVKGEICPQENYLSCVGTRWPSDYGKMVTSDIVGDLANFGFTIVSGLARGIDTLSHKVALEKGKRTIAIVGNGLDIVFPPENKNLAQKIEKNGAIISEFPLGTPPLPYNFPLRNRTIAGMSKGILVIEAKEKSGALITANLALEEGREIFAIPGPIYSKTSAGCNKLIKEGAHLVTSANDILSLFNLEGGIKLEKEIKGKTNEENIILDVLKQEPKTIEKIIKETKMPASTVNSLLVFLEIEGKIKKTGEKYYINR
jgi:DNA processing protein